MGVVIFTTLVGVGCGSEKRAAAPVVAQGCLTEAGVFASAGPLSCPQSLADFCSQATNCPPARWVDVVSEQTSTGIPRNLFLCDVFDYAKAEWYCGGQTSVLFAYDKTTGNLVGAVEFLSPDANGQACLGGPATVGRLGSCSTFFDCFPNDAGYDAGACDRDGAR